MSTLQAVLGALTALAALATPHPAAAQRAPGDSGDSGGDLPPEQAAYDVTFYDLDLRIEPADSTIRGSLTAWVRIEDPLDVLVLDLDPRLAVDSVVAVAAPPGGGGRIPYRRDGSRLRIDPGRVLQPGETFAARVFYGGRPLVATAEPGSWSDGFYWRRTADGRPWVGVVSVLNGADVWWPVKDHPSDEPDSMALAFTVPGDLEVATNGRRLGIDAKDDGTRTHRWLVSTPVNNYGVTVNVAPYVLLDESYTGVTGGTFPVRLWVLPEHEAEGRRALPEFIRHLRWFEETLGPYPFRTDKYGVAETLYLGMEHQSIISYGSDFTRNDAGFDWLHFHELSHEWWANLVTARDWKDWWLHESFGSYMEALYAEHLGGEEAYHAYLPERPFSFANEQPVAPRTSRSTKAIYGGDIYGKGAQVLHALRWLVGRDALLAILREWAYPEATAGLPGVAGHGLGGEGTPGDASCRCRLTDTDAFVRVAEAVSGRELGWFFDAYVHRAELPRLVTTRRPVPGGRQILAFRWEAGGLPFHLPVPVRVGEEPVVRLAMDGGSGLLEVPAGAAVEVDPEGWLLMETEERG